MTEKTRTSQKQRTERMLKARRNIAGIAAAAVFSGVVFFVSACAPTYPKEGLAEAVTMVCKTEYDMDVDVVVEGNTVGIYHPMAGLLDVNMGIDKDAWDKISNLILIASRVVLSTDADIEFYCVITQDMKLPELQVVIIKYVEDVKRGMYRDISRSESFKRTLFSINLTPQARKERSVENIFSRIGVADETKEKVMDEFFRSAPTKLTDIGYWKGKFYLKNISIPEFLAAQMANRIKIDFRSEKDLIDKYSYKSAEGTYNVGIDSKYFLLNFNIDDMAVAEPGEMSLKEAKIQRILEITHDVVYGYKFNDFDFALMNDQADNAKLKVKEKDIYQYNPKKTAVQVIVQAPSGYFL